MALPEAWPVAISRGDFTAAAGWFCFSFDCFSLVCATATSDKHANPNTKILLFILFSPMCGERTTLALSIRAPDKLSPLQTQRCCALAPGPASYRGTGWPCGAGALARENSIDAAASVSARAPWEEHDFRACPERSRRAPNRLPLVIPRHLLTTTRVQVDNGSHFSPALGPALNLQINQGHSNTIGRRGR